MTDTTIMFMKELLRFAYDNSGKNRYIFDFRVSGERVMHDRKVVDWSKDGIVIENGKKGRELSFLTLGHSWEIFYDGENEAYTDYICKEYFSKTYDEMADKLYSLYASGSWLDSAKVLKTERLNTGRNAHYLMVEYNGRIIEACISYSTCIGFRFVGANTEFVFSRKYSPTSSKHWSLFRNHK